MTTSNQVKAEATDELQLLDAIVERAAEQLGDVHPQILAYFFAQHPEAKQVFTHHGGAHQTSMQHAMVDWGLYCLFCWLEHTPEAKNVLTDAARQHKSKHIDLEITHALMTSIFFIIGQSICDESSAERQLWNRLEAEIIQCLIQAESL